MTPEAITAELLGIHQRMDPLSDADILTGPADACARAFARLDRLAATSVDEPTVDALLEAPVLAPVWPTISRLRRVYNLRLEVAGAQALLDAIDPWNDLEKFHFWPNYRALARMEMEGAELRSADRVVFLGAGPLPLSLVVMSRYHGVRAVGIEREPRLAELAGRVVARLGLADTITIETGDQHTLPLDTPVNLTMVAAAAEPKSAVFGHLAERLSSGSLLSYRVCERGLRRLLDPAPLFVPPSALVELRRVHPVPPVNNTVVVMRCR